MITICLAAWISVALKYAVAWILLSLGIGVVVGGIMASGMREPRRKPDMDSGEEEQP